MRTTSLRENPSRNSLAKVYLSLGSNLGDRGGNIIRAITLFPEAGLRVRQKSSLYETEPVDLLQQPWFLNTVVEVETKLEPLPLMKAIRGIETHMRSRKAVPKGPRVIDVDILFYGEKVLNTPEVQIPHPRLHLRRFVLVPLEELAPSLRHPVLGLTVTELLARAPDRSEVRRWSSHQGTPS